MITIAELEADMAARIVAIPLTGKAYAQDRTAWQESPTALTASRESAIASHLTFSVSVEDAPVGASQHHAGQSVGVLGARLAVLFMARIRGGQQQADMRLASDAARDVAGVLLAQYAAANISPVNMYRPGPIVDQFMAVRLDFSADFDLSITPQQLP